MPRPDRPTGPPAGTGQPEVRTPPLITCAQCFAAIIPNDMGSHQQWHSSGQATIMSANRITRRSSPKSVERLMAAEAAVPEDPQLP